MKLVVPEPIYIGLGLRNHDIDRGRVARQRFRDVGRTQNEGLGKVIDTPGFSFLFPFPFSSGATRRLLSLQVVPRIAAKGALGTALLRIPGTVWRINESIFGSSKGAALGRGARAQRRPSAIPLATSSDWPTLLVIDESWKALDATFGARGKFSSPLSSVTPQKAVEK